MSKSTIVERTAPSPTGHLHLGHIFSALTAYNNSKRNSGLFKLRIEDIDQTRCKPMFEKQILSDLKWLGINWDGKILRQSERKNFYQKALRELQNHQLLYPCSCTRKDIKEALSAPHKDELKSPVYPGTCINKTSTNKFVSLRLNIKKAIQLINKKTVIFRETGIFAEGESEIQKVSTEEIVNKFGDIVLARKDIGTSYHLAVVVDDAAQSVTNVTRGADLFEITPIQILLHNLLNLRVPIYHHHRLILDKFGKRLAKRNQSNSILSLRENGLSPEEVMNLLLKKGN